MHTIRLPHCELELPHIPECGGIVQAGKDIFHPRPCAAILQPTQLNSPPQFVVESELFNPLRFVRSDPFGDRIDSDNIRRDLDVGVMPAQDLGLVTISRLFATTNLFARAPTS